MIDFNANEDELSIFRRMLKFSMFVQRLRNLCLFSVKKMKLNYIRWELLIRYKDAYFTTQIDLLVLNLVACGCTRVSLWPSVVTCKRMIGVKVQLDIFLTSALDET
jgi:hypothetical protein